MVAQTQAQNITLTINGSNYSQYLMDVAVGWDSWQAGAGLRLKTGEIALTSITSGVNLDPRDNTDFAPGNVVTVVWNAVSHPLAAKMLILAPPTIEPLLSELPTAGGNLMVKIPIGCTLAYYRTYQPDDDESGVTLGTGEASNIVIERLLLAAGIPSGDIGTIPTLYNFDYPIQKQNGGFVEMAGEVAYCTCGTPGYLYCNNQNVVQGAALDLDSSSTITVTLGTNDRNYEPQLDSRLPPGFVKAVGIRRRVISPNTCEVTRYEEPEIIYQRFEICRFESRDLILNPKDRFTINAESLLYNQFFNVRYIYERQNTEIPDPRASYFGRLETARSDGWKVYMGDQIRLEVLEKYQIRADIAPDLVAQVNPQTSYRFQMEHSETIITRYEYQSDGTVKAISFERWLPAVVIAPDDNTNPNVAAPWILKLAEQKRTEWSRKGTLWTERVTAVKARGLATPDFVEDPASPGLTYYDLISTPEAKTAISNTGDTTPPRTDYWQPLPYEEEDQLEAEAKFEKSKQRAVLQVPYAFTTAQLQAMAEAEGEITWGRAYQYLIECEPSLFDSQQAPHPIVRVRGAGENRTFLADAIQWQHTNSETFVGFAGIYLGVSGGDPETGGSFSRASGIAPIIAVPTGATASGSTTPTGNPRQPLPSDGLIMVGVDSVLREALIQGELVVT